MNDVQLRKQVRAWGSWPSPITASLVAGKALRLGQPRIDGDAVYWTETRPQEKGRTVLVRWTQQQGCSDITPTPYSVQTQVHEYGGGAYTVDGDRAWFVDRTDQCIHEVHGSTLRSLTEPGTRHFADLVHDAPRDRLLAICEDHDPSFTEPRASLVAIDCNTGAISTLAAGADFYSSARLSPDGSRLAWLQWNHPDMPWDGTFLHVADLDESGQPCNVQCIAGSTSEAIAQPLWRSNDELVFASDRTGWWNLYIWKNGEVHALHPTDAEFALPHWVFGMQSWGFRDADHIICAYSHAGVWRLGEINIDTAEWQDITLPYTQIDHLHAINGMAVLHAASPEHAARIVLLDENLQAHELRAAADSRLDHEFLAAADAVTFPTSNGETAHALYYAPASTQFDGEPGTAPPMLVKAHGGPTAATSSALDLKIRYWTSRGFAVLDVNYRGSTGYGRRYRESLYGNWGVFDVEDCIHGAREMAARGLADPERLLISGSSAGGFTALAALTFHDVFAAGGSYYGVADLAGAMRDTAKFESRYGDKLVGPLPETEALWRERSPLFNAHKLRTPVIFFQGLDDRVVPPDQSERMYEAARANGVTTAYLPFPGEGHGFRQAQTIEAALTAEYEFYCRVLDITPSEGGSND